MTTALEEGFIIAHVHRQENVTLVEIEKPPTPAVAGCRREILAQVLHNQPMTVVQHDKRSWVWF